MAGRTRRTREADLRAQLTQALPEGEAKPPLLDALSRAASERAMLEDHEMRVRLGVEWVRDTRRVGRQLPQVLDRLLRVLLSIDPFTKHEFDKVVPGWEEHLLQLLRLRAVAEECAAIEVPTPGKGSRPEVPHLLAQRVKDVLASNGVKPKRGTLVRVLTVVLTRAGYPEGVDIEGLARAVTGGRPKASKGKPVKAGTK